MASKGERGAETRVLLMDDDSMVLGTAYDILKDLGYEVMCARNGEEAILHYKESMKEGRPFHVVILDLMVREGMGGREANEKLREMDANCNTVVSSGYSGDAVMGNYRKHGFSGVLAKPYGVKDLAVTLDRIMTERKVRERDGRSE